MDNGLRNTETIKRVRGTYLTQFVLKLLKSLSRYLTSMVELCGHPCALSEMAGFEEPPMSYEETKDRAKVELRDLSEGSPIEGKYMGTDTDRHDMIVLGRKQVLRVRKNTAMRSVAFRIETSYGDIVDLELMVPSSAQFPIPIYRGLCRRSNFYLGDSLRVCDLPYSGSQMPFY